MRRATTVRVPREPMPGWVRWFVYPSPKTSSALARPYGVVCVLAAMAAALLPAAVRGLFTTDGLNRTISAIIVAVGVVLLLAAVGPVVIYRRHTVKVQAIVSRYLWSAARTYRALPKEWRSEAERLLQDCYTIGANADPTDIFDQRLHDRDMALMQLRRAVYGWQTAARRAIGDDTKLDTVRQLTDELNQARDHLAALDRDPGQPY